MVDCSSLSSTLYRMNPTVGEAPLCVHLFELEPGIWISAKVGCISSIIQDKVRSFRYSMVFLDVFWMCTVYSAWKNDSQMKSQHKGTSRSGPGSRFCGSFLHGLLFKVLCEKKKLLRWTCIQTQKICIQLSLETVLTTLKFNIIQRRNIKVVWKLWVWMSQNLQSSTRSRRPSLLRPRLSEPCRKMLAEAVMILSSEQWK